jgi:cytochrome bd-type quinol oxidase subunit 2
MNNSENKKTFWDWFWFVGNVIMSLILIICLIDHVKYKEYSKEQEEKKKK